MTSYEFIQELKKLDAKWFLDDRNRIRATKAGRLYCPITAICEREKKIFWPVHDVDQAAWNIDLDKLALKTIVAAADDTGFPGLRGVLLKACKL